MSRLPGLLNFPQDAEPADKAAFIAESVIDSLPDTMALAARRCVILHWFDRSVMSALLPDASEKQSAEVFQQLINLPFVESVPGGFAFHTLTRQGLLNQYMIDRSDLLIDASKLATPAYATRANDNQAIAEAFFCTIISGDTESAAKLLYEVYDNLSARGDWSAISYCLSLQDEAETLPFVKPLPRDKALWLMRSIVHDNVGDFSTALNDLDHLIELAPDYSFAYFFRGQVYYACKNYSAALVNYTRAINLAPEHAQTYLHRGLTYHDLKKYERALADYTRAIEIDSNYAMGFCNRGFTYAALEKYGLALADYSRALDLNPDMASVYNNRGNVFAKLNDYKAALADYNRTLELAPNSAQTYYNRGTMYAKKDDFRLAVADFTRAVELDPSIVRAYNNRGLMYVRLGDYPAALADYTRTLELDPNHAGAVYNIACAYALQNDVNQACNWLRKAIVTSDEYIGEAQSDPDFDTIRGATEFQALMQEFGNKSE
jgi:tetratricopeptide (TPR) repeat protein